MNIYEFIGSTAIRSYCEKIGHQFTPVEAAFLIYQSNNHTIKQKHAAWRELIETTLDMPVENRTGYLSFDSLHAYLREYMALHDKLVNELVQNDGDAEYTFDILFKNKFKPDYEMRTVQIWGTFTDFYEGVKTVNNYEKEHNDYEPDVKAVHCYVGKAINNGRVIYPFFTNTCGDLFDVGDYPQYSDIEELNGKNVPYKEKLLASFEGLWINVPTPFKRGDIVYINRRGYQSEPFVLDKLCTECFAETSIEDGLLAYGYHICRDYPEKMIGHLHRGSFFGYLDLEYWNDELTGTERILYAISRFMNESIDIAQLLEAFRFVLAGTTIEGSDVSDLQDAGVIGIEKARVIERYCKKVE